MHLDEIYKFCDKTLQLVCKILRERLLNFKFGYNKAMPLREWTKKDKRHTGIMVNKIDDLLVKRRIMRSLEVLVGGRKTKMDKQLLPRTVFTMMMEILPELTLNKLCGRVTNRFTLILLSALRRSDKENKQVGPHGTKGSCKYEDGDTSFQ
ncbi:hypothetical protein Tco_1337714 [Tanacetum coccineum]